jgi:hypothetical protein
MGRIDPHLHEDRVRYGLRELDRLFAKVRDEARVKLSRCSSTATGWTAPTTSATAGSTG